MTPATILNDGNMAPADILNDGNPGPGAQPGGPAIHPAVHPAGASAAPQVRVGIAIVGDCSSRCWFAHGNVCRCPCAGGNHGAMTPGRDRLRSDRDGVDLQTVMWEPGGAGEGDAQPRTAVKPRAGRGCPRPGPGSGRLGEPEAKRGENGMSGEPQTEMDQVEMDQAEMNQSEMDQSDAEHQALAQQALAIYGDGGAEDLHGFIAEHHAGTRREWNEGFHPLEDGSIVRILLEDEAPDVGIGYMVLAVVFPLAVMAATVWSLRN